MKKVERVELVLENCEVFEIRAEDIGFMDIKMEYADFKVSNDEVSAFSNQAIDVFFEVARIYGTFVLSDDFVEGEDYVVNSERLSDMDIVYMEFYYDDGSYSRVDVPFNTHLVPEESWQVTNELEHVIVTNGAVYVMIGEGKIEDRVDLRMINSAKDRIDYVRKAVEKRRNEERKNSEFVKSIHRSLEESRGMTLNPVSDEERNEVERKGMDKMGDFMRTNAEIHEKYMESDSSVLSELLSERLDAIPVIPSIQLDEIKVGGRVAYVNRQGDVVVEYVTDISGEFVGLGSGNVIHFTKVTALVSGK